MTSPIINIVAESFGQPGLRQPPVLEDGGGQPLGGFNGQPLGGFPWLGATAMSQAGS